MSATKGEWRAERNGDTWQVVSTLPDGSEMAVATIEVARPGFTSPMDASDAKLMAASKDMFSVLAAIRQFIDAGAVTGFAPRGSFGSVVDALDAAISKAGGKS